MPPRFYPSPTASRIILRQNAGANHSGEFLEDQKRQHRRPKTLEWHEHALGFFQHYLLTEHQCLLLEHITEMQVRNWFVALSQLPTAIGTFRSPNTIESYARSARAFCQWLVQHQYLSATSFADLPLSPVESRPPLLLEAEEWEQLLLACSPPKETGASANLAAARNRAILWVLFDTGMHSTEIGRLCLGDVDREQGMLRVQGKGTAARWLTLGSEGQRHLLAYLDQYRLKMTRPVKQGRANSEPLFLTETGRPLTKGTIGLLFGRLTERVVIPGKTIGVSLVRKNFTVRYMQTGGDQQTLLELLGQQKSSMITRSIEMSDEMIHNGRTTSNKSTK